MTLERLSLWVPGHPRTKGSLSPETRGDGSVRLVDTPESKRWRREMTLAIRREVQHARAAYVIDAPVMARLTFYTPYEPTHPYAGDLDKLERNALDAMTKSAFTDDRFVVGMNSTKVHAAGTVHGPGAFLELWEVPQ